MRTVSLPSIIVAHDRNLHRWIGTVTDHRLCVIEDVVEFIEHEFCFFETKNGYFYHLKVAKIVYHLLKKIIER